MPDVSSIDALPNVNSKASFLQEFKENGFCVIPSIIPQERLDQYTNDAYDWLESFDLGFKRGDKSTWTEAQLPVNNVGGLYGRYCIGHESWVWKSRCEPGVIAAFAELWGTDELIVSFDGANVTFPVGEHGRTDVVQTPAWPHTDQNPHRPSFQLAQGIVAISESGPNDGGLVVLKGSHLLHPKYHAEHGGIHEERRVPNSEHGYRWQHEDLDWYKKLGCEEIKVECPAGSLIMWDSRTIHWNRMPTGERVRIATYNCYCPRRWADEAALKTKAEIFHKRQTTTHWPAENHVKMGAPMRNGVPCPKDRVRPWKEPVETPLVLKLAGVEAY